MRGGLPPPGGGAPLGSAVVPGAVQVASGVLLVVVDGRVQPEPAGRGRPQLLPVTLRHPGHLDPRTSVPPGPAPPPSGTETAVSRSSNHDPGTLIPIFVTDPDRVHHDDPPSRPGVVAVSVSLRHQRSSVTTQRPPPGVETQGHRPDHLALTNHRDGVGQAKTGNLSRGNVLRGGVQRAWEGATLLVRLELMFVG